MTWRLKVAGKSQAFRLPLPRYIVCVCVGGEMRLCEGGCVCE